MGKAFVQFMVLAVLFFAAWFCFSRIDFVKRFHLDNMSRKTEQKLGELLMKTVEQTNKKVDDDSAQQVLAKINRRLCGDNMAETNNMHIYLVENSDINAFALPGNNLVVYTGLIKHCDSVEELCGVMAHEIGHIKLHHVKKRLAGEMGITVLTSMTANGKAAAQAIKLLSSSAFERNQESAADAYAVRCLQRAQIDPDGFAGFMIKIAELQSNVPEELEWISSHPDSRKRADAIRALAGISQHDYKAVISKEEWVALKAAASR